VADLGWIRFGPALMIAVRASGTNSSILRPLPSDKDPVASIRPFEQPVDDHTRGEASKPVASLGYHARVIRAACEAPQ
jgi:hypothetical protein